ncbi:MAG: alkaline phosphatase family protein [Kouleothrix sp.]
MGYYTAADLPFYWNIADEYVLFDRFFSSAARGSLWNRMYWISATPGSPHNQVPAGGYGNVRTIFDALEQRGVPWKIYIKGYRPAQTYRAVPAGGKLPAGGAHAYWRSHALSTTSRACSGHIVSDIDQYFEGSARRDCRRWPILCRRTPASSRPAARRSAASRAGCSTR